MGGSHFIVQTRKFMLIDATAVTLGQGNGEVIQYILPDLYILYPKYLRFRSKGFDVSGKSRCGGGRNGRGGKNCKHEVTPDWSNLIKEGGGRFKE